MGELREARIPMRPAIGVVVEADGVYFSCFSMTVHGFAEATTDTICDFYLFNIVLIKQAFCMHRMLTFAIPCV